MEVVESKLLQLIVPSMGTVCGSCVLFYFNQQAYRFSISALVVKIANPNIDDCNPYFQ